MAESAGNPENCDLYDQNFIFLPSLLY